jgi:hypothetical protein
MSDQSNLTKPENLPLHTHPELMLNMEEPLLRSVLNSEIPYVTEKLASEDAEVKEINSWPIE